MKRVDPAVSAPLAKEANSLLKQAHELLNQAAKLAEQGQFNLSFLGAEYYPKSFHGKSGFRDLPLKDRAELLGIQDPRLSQEKLSNEDECALEALVESETDNQWDVTYSYEYADIGSWWVSSSLHC